MYKIYHNNTWRFSDMIKGTINNNNIEKPVIEFIDKYTGLVCDIEISPDLICKPTKLKDFENNIVYENDIINIDMEDSKHGYNFIVKYFDGYINFNDIGDVYVNGLVLMDFNNNPYLIGRNIIEHNACIKVIGHMLENENGVNNID